MTTEPPAETRDRASSAKSPALAPHPGTTSARKVGDSCEDRVIRTVRWIECLAGDVRNDCWG